MNISIPQNITVWGLTGGIASGKSVAAAFFRELGIEVINLDTLGREILDQDPSTHEEIRILFGPSVFSGRLLNKKALREIIFKDASQRKKLEKLMHPKIWNLFETRLNEKAAVGTKLVLCEAALLVEHQHHTLFPRLIVVLADEAIRKQRALRRDQMDPNLFCAILKSQVTDEQRRQVATDILINNGDQGELRKAVIELVAKWKREGLLG